MLLAQQDPRPRRRWLALHRTLATTLAGLIVGTPEDATGGLGLHRAIPNLCVCSVSWTLRPERWEHVSLSCLCVCSPASRPSQPCPCLSLALPSLPIPGHQALSPSCNWPFPSSMGSWAPGLHHREKGWWWDLGHRGRGERRGPQVEPGLGTWGPSCDHAWTPPSRRGTGCPAVPRTAGPPTGS